MCIRDSDKLDIKAEFLLIDGNDKIPFDYPYEYLIKGDGCSQSIAAASIMAKVTRDRYMKQMAEVYPEYYFEKHKGYGTKIHMEAIREHGICPVSSTHLTNFGNKCIKGF